MLTASLDLLNKLLDAGDSGLDAKGVLDGVVVGERSSLSLDLSVSSLVDELGDGLSVWNSVGDPWLDDSEHVHGGLIVSEEDGVVDLQ